MLERYDIADGKTAPGDGDPQIVFCMDEFGQLNLLPRPGKQSARISLLGCLGQAVSGVVCFDPP